MFSNVWSENTALFERLMEIHSNSPKLYYGFNPLKISSRVYSGWGLWEMGVIANKIIFNGLMYNKCKRENNKSSETNQDSTTMSQTEILKI